MLENGGGEIHLRGYEREFGCIGGSYGQIFWHWERASKLG